jgi:hypothetical protein
VTSLAPKFWSYIIRRFGSLGGPSRFHLMQESLPDCFSNFLCVSKVSLRVEFINLMKGTLLQLSPQCTTSVNFCILLLSYYNNKPAYATPRSCDWKSGISNPKCLARAWTSTPLEPAARLTPTYLASKILLGIQERAWSECNIFVCYLCTGNWCGVNVISLCVICVQGTGAYLFRLLCVNTLTLPGSIFSQLIITKSSLSVALCWCRNPRACSNSCIIIPCHMHPLRCRFSCWPYGC